MPVKDLELNETLDALQLQQDLLQRLVSAQDKVNVAGIGTDILYQYRIEKVFARHGLRFVERILTKKEQQRWQEKPEAQQLNFLAKRYCAKEAVSKALGTGIGAGVSFQQMQIEYSDLGQPIMQLSGVALEKAQALSADKVLLSLSDDQETIVCFALLV